jgi:N-carbamoyl-L-amino-acid hydrolase
MVLQAGIPREVVMVGKRVDMNRLWQAIMDLAKIGATPNGGVRRLALTDEEFEARKLLISWAQELNLSVYTDAMSNLFFRSDGLDANAAPIMTGSHIDTQPSGGKFDGAFGVVAGFEAIRAMHEADYNPRHPIEVVAWLNEEGSRFSPGMMGSEAFTQRRSSERILAVKDAEGITTREALDRAHSEFPDIPQRPFCLPVAAFLEAHIEQGPRLEAEGIPVGVVTGIQGSRRYRVEVTGEEAHAGTTPRRERKDALFAAQAMIAKMREIFCDADDLVKFTVGLFEISPNAPSVVPSRAFFSIDLRHPDWPTLKRLGDGIADICTQEKGPCEVEIREIATAESLNFPKQIQDVITTAARDLEIDSMPILSAAGHDARQLHYHCPTGMIFVPCEKGISHNEAENCTPEDLADGARVLAGALVRLDQTL